MASKEKLQHTIDAFAQEKFHEGLRIGISEMEKFIEWHNATPDTKRQAEQRQWMIARLEAVKKKYGIA